MFSFLKYLHVQKNKIKMNDMNDYLKKHLKSKYSDNYSDSYKLVLYLRDLGYQFEYYRGKEPKVGDLIINSINGDVELDLVIEVKGYLRDKYNISNKDFKKEKVWEIKTLRTPKTGWNLDGFIHSSYIYRYVGKNNNKQ